MSTISEYKKIRELSKMIHLFQENIRKNVRLKLIGNYNYIVEPIEMKGMECFFRLIGTKLNNHPIVSQSIHKIKEIIPI